MSHYVLIMCGGQGTRFWPESTSKKPKQFLAISSKNSLFTETLMRIEKLVTVNNRYIISVKEQEALIREHSGSRLSANGLVFEPTGKNTAPCILLSLLKMKKDGAKDSDVVAILPCDHVILNQKGFGETLEKSLKTAETHNKIVVIGINPNFPHTGYGYIHKGEDRGNRTYQVKNFKEKPNLETAKKYVESGEYFWNAGMFVAPIGLLLSELKEYCPQISNFASDINDTLHDYNKLKSVYLQMPSISIDYAVMEKSKNVFVIPAEFDWNDLGSWDALEEVCEKSNDNVVFAKNSRHVLKNSKGNIVFSPNQLVALVNVNNLIVVNNQNVLMILPKEDSQEVKSVVEHLKGVDWGKEHI